jgi:PAS domain S-box-containing protein
LFEAVCNNATGAIFLMNERQHCVYMNPAAEALTGYTLNETRGRPLHDVVHHTRLDGSRYPLEECPIDRAFPERMQMQGEEVFVHKDGRFYPVAYTASPIHERGVIVGTIVEVRDISQQKRAEAALRESERRLLLAKSAAKLGIYDYNVVSGRITWDARVREIWGVPPELAITYDVFMNGLHPSDRAPTQVAVDRALDPLGPGEYRAEYRVISQADGVERWVLAVGQVYFAGGRAVRLVGTVEDITARKHAEDELRASRERLAAVLDCLPMGVGFVDLEGKLALGNPEMQRYVPNVIPSRDQARHGRWRGYHPNGRCIEASDFPGARALRGEVVRPSIEFLYTQEDGREIWTRVAAVPLRDPQGRVSGAVVVVTDIGGEKRVEQELKVLLAEKERLAQHNELVAREMSHRIMNSFQLLSSLFAMQMRAVQDPAARVLVEGAMARVGAMAVVQRRLFQATREDVGSLDLGAYLRGLAEELVASVMGESCRLGVAIPSGIRMSTTQASSLGMIVTELVINACKHAFKSGRAGTLTVRLDPLQTGGYRLQVADDGVGLPHGLDLGRSGGLGMRLVRSLVRQLEGTLEIDGNPPGVRFVVVFPG